MVLNLRVMAPNRMVWNSEVWEIVSSTNSGQIGILSNHAPLLTALDMGVLKIRHDGQALCEDLGTRWSRPEPAQDGPRCVESRILKSCVTAHGGEGAEGKKAQVMV